MEINIILEQNKWSRQKKKINEIIQHGQTCKVSAMSQMEKTKHCANLNKQMDKVKSKINQKGWCSGETKCKEGVNVTVMCVNKTHGGDDSAVFWDVGSWYCIPEIDIIIIYKWQN